MTFESIISSLASALGVSDDPMAVVDALNTIAPRIRLSKVEQANELERIALAIMRRVCGDADVRAWAASAVAVIEAHP